MILLLWLLNALALTLVSRLVPGFEVHTLYAALMAALLLGLANVVIRPILFLFTLPINLLTLGLFSFVLNALMILLVSTIVKGFEVNGFWPAFYGAIILWLISWITNSLLYSQD